MFFVLISSLIRPMDISTPCLSACHSLLCRNDKESACSKICTYQKRWVYGHMSSSIFQGVQLAEGFEPTVPERIPTPGTERIPPPGTRKNSNPRYRKDSAPRYQKDSNPRYPKKKPKKLAVSPCYMSSLLYKGSSF